jgi:hypothetical protein
MTEYHYTTYRIGNLTLPDDVFLTPKQEKEIHARIQAALDRSMIEVLTGGNYVPALHETAEVGVEMRDGKLRHYRRVIE